MTVAELIESLQKLPQNLEVLLSSDDAINSTHECFGAGVRRIDSDGTVSLAELTPELAQAGYTDEDVGDPETTRLVVII